jgi:organic radical activating enzyme
VATCADLISLSSKLPNSTPVPGTWMPYLNREVTESDKKQHEKWRQNYQAMKALITYHPDYQFKPVISDEKDLEEVKYLQEILGIPNDKVYLMPEGMNKEQVESRRKWLSELCQKEGYNFTDRLHILIYGDQRGV